MVNLEDIEKYLANIANVASISFLVCDKNGEILRYVQPEAMPDVSLKMFLSSISADELNHLKENTIKFANGRPYTEHFLIQLSVVDKPLIYDMNYVGLVDVEDNSYIMLGAKPVIDRDQRDNLAFLSMISHELLSPLASTMSMIALLKEQIHCSSKHDVLINSAYENMEHLKLMFDDLFSYQTLKTGKMTFNISKVNLYTLAKQAIELNNSYMEKYDVHPVITGERDVVANCDAIRTIQMISNFLTNAAKHSPKGAEIKIHIEALGKTAKLSVIDSGAGIPIEFQPFVFERYSQSYKTTSEQKGGVGLGMYLTKIMTEKQKGEIGFTSQVGVGTEFFFKLPLA